MQKPSGEKQPRLGRPPIPKELARSNRVVTFVTDTELAELTRSAERKGQSLSAHVHEVLRKGMRRRDV